MNADTEAVAARLQAEVAGFVARRARPELLLALDEEASGQSAEVWAEMRALGWLGVGIPVRSGGAALGLAGVAAVNSTLSAASLPSSFFATAVEAAGLLMACHGSSLACRLLEAIANGHAAVTTALWSDGPELDPSGAELRASGGHLLLNGRKLLAPYAGSADTLLVTASSRIGLALVAVPACSGGVSLRRMVSQCHDVLYEVRFDNVQVTEGDIVVSNAVEAISDMVTTASAIRAHELAAIGKRALSLTITYVGNRMAFGRRLGQFQAVQHHCADMLRDVDVVRVLAELAIRRGDEGLPMAREASMAKVKAGEAIPQVLELANQLHGGVGYYEDYPLGRLYRWVMALQGTAGSARWHRKRLRTMIQVEPDSFVRSYAHETPVH